MIAFTLVNPEFETESIKQNVKLLMKWFHKLIAPAVNLMKWHERNSCLTVY